MEDLREQDQQFDLVTRSLIFGYVEDFDELMECQESHTSDELRNQYPDLFGGNDSLNGLYF